MECSDETVLPIQLAQERIPTLIAFVKAFWKAFWKKSAKCVNVSTWHNRKGANSCVDSINWMTQSEVSVALKVLQPITSRCWVSANVDRRPNQKLTPTTRSQHEKRIYRHLPKRPKQTEWDEIKRQTPRSGLASEKCVIMKNACGAKIRPEARRSSKETRQGRRYC